MAHIVFSQLKHQWVQSRDLFLTVALFALLLPNITTTQFFSYLHTNSRFWVMYDKILQKQNVQKNKGKRFKV